MVSVPSRGYVMLETANKKSATRFRPLSGLCLFLPEFFTRCHAALCGFRPLSGLCLFLPSIDGYKSVIENGFPSPLGVMSFFTKWEDIYNEMKEKVSVPSRGYVFFYNYMQHGQSR